MSQTARQIIFYLASALVVSALVYLIVVNPMIDGIRASAKEYRSNQQTLDQLANKEALYKSLSAKYQGAVNDLATIEDIYLQDSKKETVAFITTLEEVAYLTGNDFEITNADSSQTSNDGGEKFLSFRISLWGSYNALLEFIANLEDSPYPPYRLIEIEGVSITKIDEKMVNVIDRDVRAGDLETVINIKIYVQ